MAPVSFATFMLLGLRSAFIFSSTSFARRSSSFARDHALTIWGYPLGSSSRELVHQESIMTHLLRKPSALFLAFEIALALEYATKPTHAEMLAPVTRREKKWRSNATEGVTRCVP